MQESPALSDVHKQLAEMRGWLPTDTPKSCMRMMYGMMACAEQEVQWNRILAFYDFNKGSLANLSDGQRLISAVMMSRLPLSPTKQISAIAEHRQLLRAGHLRRSEDVETIAALARLTVGFPIRDVSDVERIHFAYEHLKANHWWPDGAEDVPFCALLAMLPGDINKRLSDIEKIFFTLSAHDEVPNKPLDLVLLALAGHADHIDATLQQIAHLRTNLILSGIAMSEADDDNILHLALCREDPDTLMADYVTLRAQYRTMLPVAPSSLADQCTADAIVCSRMTSLATLYRTTIAIDAWFRNRGANGLWSWSPSPSAVS